ncbi:PHD finger protein 3-like, partial [Limulus polyphemus]|uniref:PHD finger protein 3-like n=1 Tax=Limulus polyphemus TaxID=6850 RepID=A0ABM1TP08_LIMPO
MASESGEEDNSDPSFHLGAVMMDHCYSVLHEEYMRRFRLTEESESPKEEECDKSVEKLAPLPGSSSEQQVKGTDTDEQTVLSPHNEESEKQLKNDADEFLTEQTRDEENLDDTESKEDVHEKKNETEGFLEVPIQTRRQKKKLEEIMTGNLSPEKLGKDGFCKTAEADGAKLHSSNKETRPDLAKNQEEISHELPTTPKKRGRPRKNTVTNQKESEEKTDLKEDKTMPNSAETPSPRKRGRPRKSSLQLTVCEQTTVVPDKKTQMPSDAPTPIKKESQEEKYECQSEVEKLTETKELKQEDEVSSKKLEQKNKNLSSKPIDGKKMSESMHVEEYENEDDTTKVCFKHQTTKSKTKHQKRVDKKDTKSGDKDSTRKEESKTEKKQKEQTAESGQSKTKTTKRKVLRRESRTLSLEALSVEPSLFSNPDVMIKDSVGAHTENQSEPDTKLQTMPKIPLSTKKEDSEKSHDNTKLTCQADDKDEDSVTQSLKDRDILESRTNLQESEPPSLDKNQDPCESKSIEDSSSRQLRSTLEKKPSVESKKDTEKVETDLKDDKDNEKNTQECEKEYSKEDRKVANDDESGLDDSEESSDDDPDRLWCICRKPHNGRFMIGCDGCEEWFHGSCVGITRQKGQLMEKEEIEWLCPKCKE